MVMVQHIRTPVRRSRVWRSRAARPGYEADLGWKGISDPSDIASVVDVWIEYPAAVREDHRLVVEAFRESRIGVSAT